MMKNEILKTKLCKNIDKANILSYNTYYVIL